jgi:hypothetical protein
MAVRYAGLRDNISASHPEGLFALASYGYP